MSLFSRHVDRQLGRFAAGTLSPGEVARLLEHVRGCPRCAARYDQVALGLRALEAGTTARPSTPEREALRAAGLAAALGAGGGDRQAPVRRWALPALGLGLAAAAGILLVVARPGSTEWSARGGPGEPGALRVFCDREGAPLAELHRGQGCPKGARLAFAAGHRTRAAHVALRLRAPGREVALGTHPVTGSLDSPAPLPVTPPLDVASGTAVVEASFGETREQAEAGLGAGPTVRLEFAVEAPR